MTVKVLLRTSAAAAAVVAAFAVLSGAWRAVEAAIVVTSLRLTGMGDVRRFGDQIVGEARPGSFFLADIGPLCSSAGVVLLLGLLAVSVTGDSRLRVRAFARAALTVMVCNLVRIGATVVVGMRRGPGAIEHFHDTAATAFAVVFLLAGFAVFAWSLPVSDATRAPVRQLRPQP